MARASTLPCEEDAGCRVRESDSADSADSTVREPASSFRKLKSPESDLREPASCSHGAIPPPFLLRSERSLTQRTKEHSLSMQLLRDSRMCSSPHHAFVPAELFKVLAHLP